MKNTSITFPLLLSSFLLFCFLPTAHAQRFIGGIAAGINLTQVDGDEVFGYQKVGFNGGPYVKLMLDQKQRFSVTMELLYSQKGAQKKYPAQSGARVAISDTIFINNDYEKENKKFFYKLNTDYLEIPILFHYDDPRSKIGIGVGVAWSRLVLIREYQHDYRRIVSDTALQIRGSRRLTTSVPTSGKYGRYFKNDWSIIADVKIPIYKGLKFNFRFQYSLAPFGNARTFQVSASPNQSSTVKRWPFHNTLTFRVLYSFNEKYIENTKYDREGNRVGPKWVRDPDAMKW